MKTLSLAAAPLLILILVATALAQDNPPYSLTDTRDAASGGDEVTLASYDRLLDSFEAPRPPQARPVSRRSSIECDGGSACDVCCTCLCEPAGFYALYENVFAKPYFTQSDTFEADDPDVGFGPLVAADANVNQTMDWGFEYTPRLEFGFLAPSDQVGWRARYWHFDGSSRYFADGRQNLNASIYLADDPSIEIEDADLIEVVGSMELNVLDIEGMLRDGNVTYSGGVRWAKIDHNFFAAGDEFGSTAFDEFIKMDKITNVLGPTAAIERRVPLRILGANLSVFGVARAAVLFGQFEQIAVSYNNLAALQAGLNGQPATNGVVRRYNNYLVGNGELQLGMEWSHMTQSGSVLFVRGTAEGQYWANGNSPYAADHLGSGTDDYSESFSDLGFLGLGISVGYLR